MMLRKTLKPEFLNRVDEIVMFRPLNQEQIKEIVRMQLKLIEKTMIQYNMELSVTERAVEWLSEHGYDPQLGARPVKRLIQKEIINELSKQIIGGKVSKSGAIIIDERDGKIIFNSSDRGK
jgi:ATP-dependent Clp protease ATP-binding subunit ClpB